MKAPFYSDLQRRHQQVLTCLGSDILIMPAGVPSHGIGSFRQDNNFYYLTGFPEKGAVVVFDPEQDKEKVSLFIRENSRQEEVWDGFTVGVKKARELYPADAVHRIESLKSVLGKRLKGRTVYYCPVPGHPKHELIETLLGDHEATVHRSGAPYDRVKAMRAIKSPWELDQMRRAIDITGEAHHACMRSATTHQFEYQLEAEFEYACKLHGVRHFAFGAIVAAGAHGTCQHYVENTGKVGANDLILIDSGATWNGYCADITRTFPASGTFTPVQRDLYAIVLASQKAGVEMVKPGVKLHDLHRKAAHVLIEGLKELNILHGSTDGIIEKNAYKDFWPGGLCHSLGLDVHDGLPVGFNGPEADKPLEPGMVITVEPGFYSQDFNHQIPEEFKRIGIRIEDDVLVTEDGHENLSANTVKEIADVEAMVQSGK